MHIGILSDIHDHLGNLAAAIGFLNGLSADALICCGDLCSPFVVDELKKFHGPVHIVFGNNDADLFRITRKCDDRVQAHGELLEIELGGRKIAVNHFDNIARPIAHSGLFDLVCFGHNHRISLARVGSNAGRESRTDHGCRVYSGRLGARAAIIRDVRNGRCRVESVANHRNEQRFNRFSSPQTSG